MARYDGWASVTGGLIELSTLLCEAALSGRFLINWNVLRISTHTWRCTFFCL
jgi:hypothetical protein